MCFACMARGQVTSWAAFDHASGDTSAVMSAAATAGGSVAATGNQNIDALLTGYRWTGAITYSFPDARGDYEDDYSEAAATGFGSVSFNQIQAARYILEGRSSASGGPRMAMTAFEQFTSASISDAGFNNADIRIAKSSAGNPTAYAYYPVGDYQAGDVWFGTQTNYSNPVVGNYSYATMIHELGHALGLKHGQEVGGAANVAMSADRDSMEFSVMTYRSYVGGPLNGYTNETYGYAQTFMMYDIAALQHMYGADFTTNSGNTIYRWDPNTGQAFIDGNGQGLPGANRIFLTVWDGGGTDTYDFSSYTTNLQVDLNPGGWSLLSSVQQANLGNGNYARGNVFNALQYQGDARSLIEDAIGGTGNDTLSGNAASNRLNGGAGIDIAVFSGHSSHYRISLRDDGWTEVADLRTESPDGIDFLSQVERVQFIDGSFDIEALFGTREFRITSVGGTLVGTDFADTMHGSNGADTLVGLAGGDSVYGGSGNDVLSGGAGADGLVGGAGSDIFYIDSFSDQVFEFAGELAAIDTVIASTSYTLSSWHAAGVEGLLLTGEAQNGVGNSLNNNIQGCAFPNGLYGLEGDDVLVGASGSDSLFGGTGFDVLVGGSDADAFVFMKPREGADVVVDFSSGEGDFIAISGWGFGLSGAGTLDSAGATFQLGSAATGSQPLPTFLYSQGQLFFDADGAGAVSAMLIASFQGTPQLSANNFLVL